MINIPDSIFPKDSAGKSICPKCQKSVDACSCPSGEAPKKKIIEIKLNPKIRIEKSGRKGKVVTMIEGLPRNEHLLKKLAKELKSKTGSGGTHYFAESFGVIEIQGDHQDTIRAFFQ